MTKALIIRNVLADVVNDAACKLFARECGIDTSIYKVSLPDNYVSIQSPTVGYAVRLYQTRNKLIARKCWEWVRTKAEIISGLPKPITVSASEHGQPIITSQSGDSNMTTLQVPNGVWMGGLVTMTRQLYNALGEMLDSEQPQGLVTAADSMQVWLNPAAIALFHLSSMEAAVPRDTSRDWLPADLERKRVMIRDAGENPFEIDYRTQVGDGSWKQLVNRYRLVDNKYLIGQNISSEVIEAPSELLSR